MPGQQLVRLRIVHERSLAPSNFSSRCPAIGDVPKQRQHARAVADLDVAVEIALLSERMAATKFAEMPGPARTHRAERVAASSGCFLEFGPRFAFPPKEGVQLPSASISSQPSLP